MSNQNPQTNVLDLGPVEKPQLLLPGLIQRPDPTPEITVIKAPPEDLYVMMQTVIHDRPVIATFLDSFTPGDLLSTIGWLMGLMHNQSPILWSAVHDAIEVGKDVAIVLREQIEREHKEKTGNTLVFPTDRLTVIWPTGLVLDEFQVAKTANTYLNQRPN